MTAGSAGILETATTDRRTLRLIGLLALACAIWSLLFAGFAAWDQGYTTDEPLHLSWSERFWQTGETERDSLERYDSKTPIHVPNAISAGFAAARGLDRPASQRLAARLPQLAWLAVTFIAVGGLAGCLGGPLAARMAVLLAALDPNLTAHASVVTTDIPFAAATALSLWAALSHRQSSSNLKAALLGASLGVALVAKFSAVLLIPIAVGAAFAGIGLVRRLWVMRLLVCLGCAWLTLGMAYRFDRVAEPISASRWTSGFFQTVAAKTPRLPAPLPMAFLEGVDRSRSRDAHMAWQIAIAGRVSSDPLWYYFVAAWAFKTPIALMLVSTMAIPWVFAQARRQASFRWLVAHQVVNLLFFSFAFRTQLGYRFVLMLVPVTSALVAAAIVAKVPVRRLTVAALLVTVLPLAEAVRFWGDPLAFSNLVVRPKSQSYLYLANSDIEWQQNRDRWEVGRRNAGLPDNGALNPPDLQLGLNVVTTSRMAGVIPGDPFKWARQNLEPRGMAGWTHHYFDVTEEEYERFLEAERRLEPTTSAQEFCGLSSTGAMDPPGPGTPIETTEPPIGRRVSVLCVATRKGADLNAAAAEGRFEFIPSARPDLRFLLSPNQRVAYRLAPGVHAFAIVESPNRRSWLPYHLHASFSASRHGALLRIVRVDLKDLPPGSDLVRALQPPAAVNLP